ncbi:MAG: flagellar filament capping protein FliD [Sphingomonas sp.]|uniref:flagellar filament capping protein FliD n=1 Tax=Sphingomonas sp. TaxID=28214 RepID=UPI0025ECA652|nr:flagellar filament capping protein FliD [Sphingomonas sp.]MBQ1497744.1 flagellar filament capping protein FliD [Sphingomonas sp.]
MAVESIAKTLGTGSGIDITALVQSLVDNSFANKNQALTNKGTALTTQISTVGTIKSNITDFASALASLTSSGSLATQPTSSNTGILGITRLSGADLAGLSATMEVRQLAQGQVSSSPSFGGGSGSVVGSGTLTLTFGSATVADGAMTGFTAGTATPIDITIDSPNATLADVAAAINAKKAGVTATILSDSNGARLVLKSGTGSSQAFTLSGTDGLAQLAVGPGAGGSTINAAAQDARVALDGVEAKYPTNSITTMIPGARIDLVSASVGTKVMIGASAPTSAISQAVANFVETYNQVFKAVQEATDPINGPLKSDPAAKQLLQQLKRLTLSPLVPGAGKNAPSALADIGVKTNRDGTLSLDTTRLSKVLTTYPNDVEKMFTENAGLTKALSDVATIATSTKTGLGASADKYSKAQDDLADEKTKIAADTQKMRDRMTQQFAAMDAKVAAYKSTQTFLKQQIDSWNAKS